MMRLNYCYLLSSGGAVLFSEAKRGTFSSIWLHWLHISWLFISDSGRVWVLELVFEVVLNSFPVSLYEYKC